jgi:hypothetical protein
MLVIDRLLVGGIKFVLDKIAQAVESELNDEGAVREELLAAQMKLELGELDPASYAQIERALLDRMRAIRARQRGEEVVAPGEGSYTVEGVEAHLGHGGDEPGT